MIDTTLYVPEDRAAILYDFSRWVLMTSTRNYDHRLKEKVCRTELQSGNGARNLRTDGILTCAGVMYLNNNNCVLIHANGEDSLELLLANISQLSCDYAGGLPSEVFLCTPNVKGYYRGYEEVIRDTLGNVNLRKFRKRGFIGLVRQGIAIGRDGIDFGTR